MLVLVLYIILNLINLYYSKNVVYNEVNTNFLRIYYGKEAKPYQIPYQAALELKDGQILCGGAIIKNNIILTAAHCTKYDKEELQVRAGTIFRQNRGYVQTICKIINHPNYNSFTADYDIAILKLCHPFPLNKFINIISIANQEPVSNSVGMISGWGLKENCLLPSHRLRYAYVIIKNREYCKMKMNITERMICAEGQNGEDACQGDSGGPLIINRKLVGLISWGIECGKYGVPGVYTNVAVLRSFIKNHIRL